MKRNAVARIVIYSLIVLILLGILIAGLGLDLYSFRRDSELVYTDGDEISLDADEISWIELNWAAGSISIRTADTDQITFTESGTTDKYRMSYELEGGKLSIDYTARSIIGAGNIPGKDLTITVPTDWVCKGLELDGAALEVEIDGLNVLDFEIDGAANEIDFTGSLRELDCDGASCRLNLNCLEAPSKIDLDGASVEMTICLPSECGFLAEISGLSCFFHSELDYTHRDDTYSYGDKHCKISADGLSCSITVEQSVESNR